MSACTRASTPPKKNTLKDCGHKVSHIPTLGTSFTSRAVAKEEGGSVFESPSLLHGGKNSTRGKMYSNEQPGHLRKQSSFNTPYRRPPPGSPSESNCSSKLSNLGSSSSSSPSSESSFNESASSVAGELSPMSASGKEKQGKCHPAGERFQIEHTYSKTWDDTEMQWKMKDFFKQFNTSMLGAEVSEDVPIEQAAGARNSRSRRRHLGFSYSRYLEVDRELADARISHRRDGSRPHTAVMPFAEVYPRNASGLSCTHQRLPFQSTRRNLFDGKKRSGSFKSVLFPTVADEANSKNRSESTLMHSIDSSTPAFSGTKYGNSVANSKHRSESTLMYTIDSSTPAFSGIKYGNSVAKASSFKHKQDLSSIRFRDVENEMCKNGMLDGHGLVSNCRRGSSGACYDRKGMNQLEDAVSKVSCTDMKPGALESIGRSSAPYEADLGIDTQTLQPQATSYCPAKMTKPPRYSSSYQSACENVKVPLFNGPISVKPKYHGKCSVQDASPKGFAEESTSKATLYGDNIDVPNHCSGRRMLTGLGAHRSSSILHSYYDTLKDAKQSLVPVCKTRVHDQTPRRAVAFVSNGKYVEKADAFTPHAPCLPMEPKYEEGAKLNSSLPLSKSQWDWRSKSLGAKASIKSAVKNLEATFAGYRSLSLPKTRPSVEKQPRYESAKLLDRVFISPIRARRKQVGILTPIERSSKQSKETKDNSLLQRREARANTSNFSSHSAIPAGSAVIRPSPPMGYKNPPASFKSFLPLKNSTCLPAAGVTFGMESSNPSSQMADSCSAYALSSCSMMNAQLQCSFRDGLPYYTMTSGGSEEMMLAKACWVENHSSRESCAWQYLFYSGQSRCRGTVSSGWRSWIKKENKSASDPSGIMKVSSVQNAACPATRGLQPLKVLEFVLYDGRCAAAEVSHSQSLRFGSPDKPCIWPRDNSTSPSLSLLSLSSSSSSSSSQQCSEQRVLLNPTHVDMAKNKQPKSSSNGLFASFDKTASVRSATNVQKSIGGHRPSLSLDAWSDSEVPDSGQSPPLPPCSPSQVELAAMVIQISAEGESHMLHGSHVAQTPKGRGVKSLNDASESTESSLALASKPERSLLVQASPAPDWLYADTKLDSPSPHNCGGQGLPGENQSAKHINRMEEYQNSSSTANSGRQGSSESVVLLIPMGEHSSPVSALKGPSSLIERYRSGGACECGGWDLGCGINVISSECTNERTIPNRHINISAPCDQHFSLFSQGIKQELVLGLWPVEQGNFRLSFQRELSPLKAFATAVAMLHSHRSSFLQRSHLLPASRKPAPPLPASLSTETMMSSSLQSSTASSAMS